MNRYFIAYYPERGTLNGGLVYPCAIPPTHSTTMQEAPAVAFYITPRDRDRDLQAWCEMWPGKRFVTGEITGGAMSKATEPTEFVVNEKGVLPK